MSPVLPLLAIFAAAPAANSVGLELTSYGASHQSSDTVVLSPVLHGELVASGDWSVGFDWGLAYLGELSDEDDINRVRLGNPAVVARYRFDWHGGSWRVGVGGGLPLARLRDGVVKRRRDRNTLAYASGIRGNRDLWLWAPERGAVLLPTEVTWRFARVWIGGELIGALLVPMGDLASERFDVVLQAAITAARVIAWADLGARFQTVAVPTQARDRVQAAFSTFASAELGRTRVTLELTVPVGDPLAAFELWSLTAGVRVTL